MKLFQWLAFYVQISFLSCSSVLIPVSPCPKLFKYVKDSRSDATVGSVTLGGFRSAFNNTLTIVLSMAAFGRSVGSVQLLNIQDLPKNPARFVIHFPLANSIPSLVSITFNGKQLCSGSPVDAPRVTTINLRHYVSLPARDEENSSNFSDSNENDENLWTTSRPSRTPKYESIDSERSLTYTEICGQPASPAVALLFHGAKTHHGEWPWLGVLYLKNADLGSLEFRCGATLISEKLLLTAAHCLLTTGEKNQLQPNDLLISLGRYNIMDWTEPKAMSVNPRALAVHPNFKGTTLDYDIGVVMLPEDIPYSTLIRPICLWNGSLDETSIVGQLGTIVGWGFSEMGVISEIPKSIQIPIVSEVDCLRSDIGFQLTTSNRTFCAGGQGVGPCQGDSGSGMYLRRNGRWVLRGIVSHALIDPDTGKCDTRKYSVYTDVAKYRDWLEEQN